jgi:hypothetical protein
MVDEYLENEEVSILVVANFNFPLGVNVRNRNRAQNCVPCNQDLKEVQK